MANHLGKAGASIVVAEWNAEKMHRTVDELTAIGVPALGVETDIRDRDQIDAMVARTVEHFGKVDAIVNNAQTFRPERAGRGGRAPTTSTSSTSRVCSGRCGPCRPSTRT